MARRRSRPPFSATEWVEIGKRYNQAIAALYRLEDGLGVTTADVAPWVSFRRKIEDMGSRLEQFALDKIGEEDFRAPYLIRDAFDAGHISSWRDEYARNRECFRGAKGAKRPLSRVEWCLMGEDVKLVQNLLVEIGMSIQSAYTLAVGDRWCKQSHAIDRWKSKLDDLARTQHRGWREYYRLFYGARLAENFELLSSINPGVAS